MYSCKDPNSPVLNNPHDYHSSSYRPNGPSQFTATSILETSRALAWKDNSIYDVGYRIERKLGAIGSYEILAHLPAKSSSFLDSTIILTDTVYYYRLYAVSNRDNASSSESLSVSVPFTPPSDLHLTCLSSTSVELEWAAGSSFETGFRILQSVDSKSFTEIGVLPASSQSFIASSLNGSSSYSFAVQALTEHNVSGLSNYVSASYVTSQTQLVYSRLVIRNNAPVYSIAISPDGRLLWCGGEFYIDVYRVGDGTHLASLPHSYNFPVYSLRFSPDGRILAAGHGGKIWLWDASTLTKLTDLYVYNTNEIYGVAFTPSGEEVAGVSDFGQVQIWRVSDGALLNSFTNGNYSSRACDISPDGQYIATGDSLRLLQLSDGTLKESFATAHFLRSIVYHPSGDFIACIGADYKLQFWNVADGTLRREIQETFYASDIVFDKIGARIATAGRDDGLVHIWEVQNGSLLTSLNHPSPTMSVAFSPLNNIIATGDVHGTVRVWAFSGTWILNMN
jgi:WD40 repeat protein